MKLSTDSHFLIGGAHHTSGKPCQDHALSGVVGEKAFAVVADGCSTGGMTDAGSLVLALATARAIKGCINFDEPFGSSQITLMRADGVAQSSIVLGLVPDDMLATCIYSYVSPVGGFIHMEGDGVIAFKNKNGDIKIHRYDWMDNAPYYPAYAARPTDFISFHGGDVNANRMTKQSWLVKKAGGDFQDLGTEDITLGNGMRGVTVTLLKEELAEIEFVAIYTDGITQIDGLEWKKAVCESLAFKSSEGEFVKRRMNRMVKDVQGHGRGPMDDLSAAIIKISHE